MTSNEIIKADMLDIVFENRNKLYGAYTLRKFYNRRLFLSILLAFSVIFLFLFLLNSDDKKSFIKKDISEVTLVDFIIPPVPEIPLKPPTPSQVTEQVSTQAYVDKIKLVNREVLTPMPDQAELINISDISVKGLDIPVVYPPQLNIPKNNITPVQPNEPKEAPIQREPEFPGGIKAWTQFLIDNLQVPGQLDIGEKKTVIIRFLVAADGRVTGFEVLSSGGKIFDNEVIRVLKRMPKWKPAIQNNLPVSRSFTQPVTFVGSEE